MKLIPLSLLSLLAVSVCSAATSNEEAPNIVIIYTDEQNLRTLGCYRELLNDAQAHIWGPGVKVETPHLDSIARGGAIFTNFYTAVPVCTPSRGTFMTGTYASVNGAVENDVAMKGDAVTFAQILKEQLGYYTAYIGKVSAWDHDDMHVFCIVGMMTISAIVKHRHKFTCDLLLLNIVASERGADQSNRVWSTEGQRVWIR